MKRISVMLFLVLICCCLASAQKTDTVIISKDKTVAITAEQFAKLNLNYCDTFSIEVEGFYPILDEEPAIIKDTVHLARVLKAKGFKVVNTEWGNWEKGPRIFRIDLTKDNCKCTIVKLYYNYRKMKDGSYSMKVTEKIVCNKKFSYLAE